MASQLLRSLGDEGDDLDDEERERLHAALAESEGGLRGRELPRCRRCTRGDLFLDELNGALRQLAEAPNSGVAYGAPRPTGTRRVVLRGCGYHVYYTIEERRREVRIRVVWHAARGASSTKVSQSSSIALHVSVVGVMAPRQGPQPPEEQALVPDWQAPTSDPQATTTSSSTTPSQSSSSLLHDSSTGPTAPSHTPHCPSAEHVWRPATQAPTSEPQLWVAMGTHSQPSSALPSQSLSMLSPQASLPAGRPGTASHVVVSWEGAQTTLPVERHAPPPGGAGLAERARPLLVDGVITVVVDAVANLSGGHTTSVGLGGVRCAGVGLRRVRLAAIRPDGRVPRIGNAGVPDPRVAAINVAEGAVGRGVLGAVGVGRAVEGVAVLAARAADEAEQQDEDAGRRAHPRTARRG